MATFWHIVSIGAWYVLYSLQKKSVQKIFFFLGPITEMAIWKPLPLMLAETVQKLYLKGR